MSESVRGISESGLGAAFLADEARKSRLILEARLCASGRSRKQRPPSSQTLPQWKSNWAKPASRSSCGRSRSYTTSARQAAGLRPATSTKPSRCAINCWQPKIYPRRFALGLSSTPMRSALAAPVVRRTRLSVGGKSVNP